MKLLPRVVAPLLALACLALPGRAGAAVNHRGFLEVAAGGHVPLLGTRYRDMFGPGTVLGLRGGAYRPTQPGTRSTFAFEFGFEWVHLSDDVHDQPDQTYAFEEFRCLFGARWMYFVRPELHLYARAVGGVEVLTIGGTTTIAGVKAQTSGSNAGLAAQAAAGASWRLGDVNLGLELLVPWSEHQTDTMESHVDLNTSYEALSVDLLFTVSTRR
jgi:hypothetical protein